MGCSKSSSKREFYRINAYPGVHPHSNFISGFSVFNRNFNHVVCSSVTLEKYLSRQAWWDEEEVESSMPYRDRNHRSQSVFKIQTDSLCPWKTVFRQSFSHIVIKMSQDFSLCPEASVHPSCLNLWLVYHALLSRGQLTDRLAWSQVLNSCSPVISVQKTRSCAIHSCYSRCVLWGPAASMSPGSLLEMQILSGPTETYWIEIRI